MKKKAQQKKEVVPIFEPALYWEYKQHPAETLDKVQAFLTSFSNELKTLIFQQKSIEQNYTAVCEKMGYNVHPSLIHKLKQKSQFPALKNNDYGDKFVLFMNHRIDLITLKIFSFLIQQYKLNSIKFSNNNFINQAEQMKKIIQKQQQLSSLYFEWNPIEQHPKRQQIFLSLARPSLQHLILRQCRIGNDITKLIIKKIKQTPDNKLKSLDLYGNNLTVDIISEISNFLQQSKTIQFLGLSKNTFNTEEAIIKLFSSIGKIQLTEEEYEQHKIKEKQRDEIAQRNKKRKKGAPQEPVPFLFEVKDTPTGKFYVKNQTLKILNLANNGIKDSCSNIVRKFVEGNGKAIELFIQGNKFTKTVRQTFKFYQNVIS